MGDENGAPTEEATQAVTREDLADLKANPRSAIPRKLVDAPELGNGAKVWVFGLSGTERLGIDQYAGGAPAEDGHNGEKWMEAYVAMALRESDADDAKPLFDVPGPDNGVLLRMGFPFLARMQAESMALDFGEGIVQRIEEAVQDFRTAEETS